MKDILYAGVNCCDIGEVSESGLLVDGRNYYRAFCAAAHSAERYILLSDVTENESWIETLFPNGLPLDPEGPVFGEDSYEQIPAGRDTLFPKAFIG